MQRPAEQHQLPDPQHHPPNNTSLHRDAEAMPPPQLLPDSQDSQTSDSPAPSLALSTSFPSNAYAPVATDNIDSTPPSTYTQVLSSQQPSTSSTATTNDWRARTSDSIASSPASAASASPTHGSKRTASGALKSLPSDCTTTSAMPRAPGLHSRNTSVNSNASSVSELSAQLKTRLTYAMVKVHNGWEKNSIAEVENLASQISPPLSTSTASRAVHSPRASLANANRRSKDLTQAVEQPPLYTSRPNTGGGQSTSTPHSRLPPMSSDTHHHFPRGNGPPSLAPAPDLKPTPRDRRTNGVREAPPALNTSRPLQPHAQRAPATPTPQEQDAVDTLLFMSSPANSANFPQNRTGGPSSQPSPRRSGLSASTPRSHAVSGSATPRLTNRMSESSSEGGGGDGQLLSGIHPAAKRRSLGVAFKTEKDVDRLLDQMAEIVSSDDEDVELSMRPPSAPRQLPYTNGAPVNVRV